MKISYPESQEQLDEALNKMSSEQVLAIDLEFDKHRYRYGFTLCLIQLATRDLCLIIDPFLPLDLTEVYALVQNPEKLKLCFEFKEDNKLLLLHDCRPTNLYDLSIASKLLDYSQISLSNLLLEELNITIVKDSQMSNWVKRPLSQKQIDYAANDVIYLFQLYEALEPKVAAVGREEWVRQENLKYQEEEVEKTQEIQVKAKYKKDLSEGQYFVFMKLLEFREELAKKYDRPAFQIANTDFLHALSQNFKTINQFNKLAKPYKPLKTEAFKVELLRIGKRAYEEAKSTGLSFSKNAIEKLPFEEYISLKQKKAKAERLQEEYYKPIQLFMKEKYGENVGTFLLSNRYIGQLAMNEVSPPAYLQEMIVDIANEIEVSELHN